MSQNYHVYNLNNETIVVLPGARFTKNELISRLHEINKDVSNYKDKKGLASLYDSFLMDDRNKLLLINRLRKDTEFFKSKLSISQRQSIFESNANTMFNNSKNKVLNISYDVKPFTENKSIQQEITISKPNNINGNSNYQNTYISSNINQKQENGNYKNSCNDNQLRNNYSNNYSNSRNFKNNNQSNINISYSNNQFNNNNNYNQSQISVQNKYENSSNNINNNIDNKEYNNNSYIQSQINIQKNFADNVDKNIDNNKGYIKYNNEDNINYNQKYEEKINPVIKRNDNSSYFQDNSNDQKIFTNIKTPNTINIQDSKSNNNNQTNNNTYKNINNFKNISFNPSQNPFQEDNGQNMIIEEPRQSNISNEDEQENQSNPPNKREPYKEPTLLSLLIVLITIGQIFLIYKYWNSIVEIITNPSRIISTILGFVSYLFFGSIRNLWIIIPLILLVAVVAVLYQQYFFKNRCKEIIKKIKEYLLNNQDMGENNIITEDDIYQRIVKNYGISYEEFKRKYINALRKMRRDEPRLKMSGQNINGKDIITWYLN